MPKHLNVRSDLAYEMAHALARQTRRPIAEIVESALIEMRNRSRPDPGVFASEEIERRYRELRALGSRIAESKAPGLGSNHDEFYDENGLPI